MPFPPSPRATLAAIVAFTACLVAAAVGAAATSTLDARGADTLLAQSTAPRAAAMLRAPPRVRAEAQQAPAAEAEAEPHPAAQDRRLSLRRLQTDERIAVVPFDPYRTPQPEAFRTLQFAFRAPQGGLVSIDPELVELLLQVSEAFDGKTVVLVSGHRVAGAGTSPRSYHVRGQAADIAIPGVKIRDLYNVVRELGAPGVGLYPTFVHVDVREQAYQWVGGRWRPRKR